MNTGQRGAGWAKIAVHFTLRRVTSGAFTGSTPMGAISWNQGLARPPVRRLAIHVLTWHSLCLLCLFTVIFPFLSIDAVSPGYPLKLHFQIPFVFPIRLQIFPVLIYVICDYTTYTKRTWQTYPASKSFWEMFTANKKYLLCLESGHLQLAQNKFPVFWKHFQIPCVFPDRVFFGLFSLCSG